MKPVIPAFPLALWKELYDAAFAFQAKSPWELLDDLDVVGVRDPLSSETGYGVVMGSGGTLFGLCVYRGPEGFAVYRNLISGETDPESDESFAGQLSLKVEFGSRRDLLPEDLTIIRGLGLKLKGQHAWPEFRSLKPGFLPWFLTEREARFLLVAINALSCHHDKVASGYFDNSLRDGRVLVYSLVAGSQRDFVPAWEPEPHPIKPPHHLLRIDEVRISAALARNPKPDSPWEVDYFYIPLVIGEGERPFFPRLCVVCHQESGFVLTQELLSPEMIPIEALADAIVSVVEKQGVLPLRIFVQRKEDWTSLAPLGRSLGITIQHRNSLDAIHALKREVLTRMMEEKGGGR
jgi:hypothetical protein